jgi:excisionase family DNA binding protein
MRNETRLEAVGDVARRLSVHPTTIRRWITTGMLPSLKVGGRRLLDPRDVDALLERCRTPVRGSEDRNGTKVAGLVAPFPPIPGRAP